MTDKQSFLDKLNAALVKRGVSDADIAPYIERFDRFYDRMVSDDASTSRALDNIEGIADNIAAQISERDDQLNRFAESAMAAESVSAPKPTAESQAEGGSTHISDADNDAKPDTQEPDNEAAVIEAQAEQNASADIVFDDGDITVTSVSTAQPARGVTDTTAEKNAADAVQINDGIGFPDVDEQPTSQADVALINERVNVSESEGTSNSKFKLLSIFDSKKPKKEPKKVDPTQLPEYIEEDRDEHDVDYKKFYIVFFATLPITVVLALAGIALFVGLWAVLGVGIVALMAALVGASASGAAVSLVGIVYGIIRLFDEMAVGLYEIGLGVLVAGITMLAGILMYNAAIRLFPFLMRELYVLFRFVVRKLKELFFYLRRECSKL